MLYGKMRNTPYIEMQKMGVNKKNMYLISVLIAVI